MAEIIGRTIGGSLIVLPLLLIGLVFGIPILLVTLHCAKWVLCTFICELGRALRITDERDGIRDSKWKYLERYGILLVLFV